MARGLSAAVAGAQGDGLGTSWRVGKLFWKLCAAVAGAQRYGLGTVHGGMELTD